MNAYRIYFDGGTPPILREAEDAQSAAWEGEDYLEELRDDLRSASPFVGYVPDPLERVKRVERLVPERGSNA